MFNVGNAFLAYTGKAVNEGIYILLVSFLLRGNNNLVNSSVSLDTHCENDFACVTLLLKSNNVTYKGFTVGNLVKTGYGSRRIRRKLYGSKLTVKSLTQRVVNLLLLCLLDNRTGDYVHRRKKNGNDNTN